MSLILEALRKSEAERRRAQAPDLFAPAQVAVAPARRLPAWLLGGGVLVLVVGAWVLVRAFAPAPERSGPANAAATAETTAVAPRPAAGVPAPPASPVPTNAAPRLLPAAEEPPAIADAPPPEPVPQPATTGAAIAAIAAGEAGDTVPAEPVPPRPDPVAPAAPEPAPASAPDVGAPPMRLSELGGDARRQLPPLKLTMHMWNEAAERRFVILDGRRLAEGDRIGAIRVAEIRRDGVILDWNGQHLELPLR